MINDRIEYLSKRKKFYESKKIQDRSFKTLSKKWEPLRIKKIALPDTKIYPDSWTYLVSNEKHPHTITLQEFREKKLKTGDKIYFQRGQIYNWAEYDIAADTLLLGSYGAGADPIFLGSTDFGGVTWTSEAGGYYSTPLATIPLWVTIDGECARQGESAWITTTANATGTTLTGDADSYNTVQSLVGAKLRHKEFNFRLSYEHTITGYNSSTNVITIAAGSVIGGASGLPFKLYGQKQYATLQGDWWYDDANDKLWVKTTATPAGTDIRVITENYAFKVNGSSGITFENIDFTQYYDTAIEAPDAPTLTVNNVSVYDNRSTGLMFYGNNTTFTLSNSSITRCGLNGVHIGAVASGSITGTNTITEIGEQDNVGWPFDTYWIKTGGCAVACFWDSAETVTQPANVDATGLVMSDLGYMGMLMIGDGHDITQCICHDFCTRWNDGGGFYTIHRATLGTSTKNVIFTECVAYNGVGNQDGVTGTARSAAHAEGLYCDNGCELITFDQCIAYDNSDIGILVNWDTRKTTITNCTVYGNVNSQVIFKQDTDPGQSPVFTTNTGNFLTDNIIVATDVGYCVENICRSGEVNYNPFSVGGDSNNNVYVRPYGALVNASRISASGAQTTYTIAAWQTYISDDTASTAVHEGWIYVNPSKSKTRDVPMAVNATGSPITVNATGYHDVDGNALGASESVAAWSALVYLVNTQATPDFLLDTFTAANGTSIAGRSPNVGPVPTIISGTHAIQSNTLTSSVNGVIYWDINEADFDFSIRTRTSNITTGLNTYFRFVDANNRFVMAFAATTLTLFEFNASASATNTWVYTGTFAANTDYYISVRVNGTSVKIWIDGLLAIDVTSNVTAAGSVGLLGGTTRTSDNALAESL